MIVNLDDFKKAMDRIATCGWIPTHRKGPTGVGKTLEDLLGIPENNASEPDFGEYELKTARDSDNSMLTLFTKAPMPPRVNTKLLQKFGYSSSAYQNDRLVLHSTLSADKPVRIYNTGKSLIVRCTDDRISLVSNDQIEEAYWDKNVLKKAFTRKYRNTLVYVKARSRIIDGNEAFCYYQAHELSEFNYEGLMELLSEGILKIDIRIGQYRDGRTHDHGTGFRIYPQHFERLFQTRSLIWER